MRGGSTHPAPRHLQELQQDVDQNDDDDQPYQEAYCLVHRLSFPVLSDSDDYIPAQPRTSPFFFPWNEKGPDRGSGVLWRIKEGRGAGCVFGDDRGWASAPAVR
jgi:hypothetical protein